MRVSPINNSDICFSGYVDKSVKKYINKCSKYEVLRLKEESNLTGKPVDNEAQSNAVRKASELIAMLQKVMEKFHPKTGLKLFCGDEPCYRNGLYLENPITDKLLIFSKIMTCTSPYRVNLSDPTLVDSSFFSDLKKPELRVLKSMREFALRLSELSPSSIDKKFMLLRMRDTFEIAKKCSWLSNLRVNLGIRKVNKFAGEIGSNEGSREQFEPQIRSIQEKARKQAKFEKQNSV